jgi:hypothetical protein
MTIFIKNNVDRRLGIERRVFLYTRHIPERRSGKERRKPIGHRSRKIIKFPIVLQQAQYFEDWDNTR